MNANPFDKSQFKLHRDWEESLIEFLCREARNPDVNNWLLLAGNRDAKEIAAFSALLLSDLLENKPGFRESASKVYEVYKAINVPDGGAGKFEEWLRSGWLNVARVANMVDAELKLTSRLPSSGKHPENPVNPV
jgi:hypothetical protein